MRKGYRLFRGLYPVSALLCSRTEPGVRVLPPRHAPAPPTWKSFCFSATRFWKRFRAVELKERTSAWETWRGGSRWVLETHERVSPKGMAVGGGRRGEEGLFEARIPGRPYSLCVSQRQNPNCQYEEGKGFCQESPSRGVAPTESGLEVSRLPRGSWKRSRPRRATCSEGPSSEMVVFRFLVGRFS